MAPGVRGSAYESVVQTLRQADLTRRAAENFEPNLYGHAGLKHSRPELSHPPLTVRPRTAQARLEAAEKNRPASPKGPPKPPPVKPQRPMGEMHASFLKNSSGEEVWTLCANGYDTNNNYSNEKAKFIRIAKPDNWRLDKVAAANDESLRGEEAKKLISSMESEALQDIEPEGATDLNASMRSTLTSMPSTKSIGKSAVFPPGMSSINDMRPSTRESVASQRSIWKHTPDPESVCSNVPACASGAHRLLRPHTAQVRMSTNLDGTGKWSAPGSKVYKSRPESAAQSYAARGFQNATSPIASYVRTAPASAKPKPRPGLSNYCSALSTMNREMIKQ